ncbi:class I SAM-dependent methyltransferase [Kordiimonas sp. SCSIO 12610]|uniref:class I SAM-dependent methyltransferase n=1 Tax=Kordiimonas sp. SCSIO 12610 TaxID=2829597 RepID=UPI00210CF6F1|nr:class I SAM-dependent methyltransferase [Kordiimonas sp. SCSIO 12610]UTW55622.1 class I SAM-dependent methyltransferase [Kordiimonas sp. SCSIO 12610]
MNTEIRSFTDHIKAIEQSKTHAAGSLTYDTLSAIEDLLPDNMLRTAETGCGRSTILFSQKSSHHTVFCLDDRSLGETSSVNYFMHSQLTNKENIECVFGPTQETLKNYTHTEKYDCVLIDGPHGYPFPDMEYYYFYPWIKEGGLLIIDDIQIASIGRMADIIQEDAMWDLVKISQNTAIFKRTSANTFPELGDHWWEQNYNQRRTEADKPFLLADGGILPSFRARLSQPSMPKQKQSLYKRILRNLRVNMH